DPDLRPVGQHVALVQVVARDDVRHVAIAIRLRHRECGADGIAERQVHEAFDFAVVEVADIDARHAAQLVVRLSRNQVDRAGNRVLAEQRALRSAQHLDAFEIQELLVDRGRLADVDAVDVYADAGIEADVPACRANAANRDRRTEVVAFRYLHVGDVAGDLLQFAHARLLDRGSTEHGDRDRHVYETLRALLRGNGDLLDNEAGILLGQSAQRRHKKSRHDGGAARPRAKPLAVFP